MWKVARRGLVANKIRFLLTAIAVILGVAFISGTLVLTATIQKTFDDLFSDVYSNTDAVVRAPEALESDFGAGQRPNVPASLLDEVRSVPGVASATGNVQIPYAQVIGTDGDVVGNPDMGPPTIGFAWDPDSETSVFSIVDGRGPERNNEIALDANTIDEAGAKIGDRLTVLSSKEPQKYRVVGVVKFGDANSLAGASATLFTLPEAQRLGNAQDQFTQITVKAESGVSQQELADSITRTLKGRNVTDFEAITGQAITKENQDALQDQIGFISLALLIFAFIALIVGVIIIYNTFSIVVAQRTREMALLRAVGASRRQVLTEILVESVLVGLFASAIGVAAGVLLAIGLRAIMDAVGFDLPTTSIVIPASAVLVGMIAGTVVTIFSAIMPALQASRVPPIAAIRDVAIERPPRRVVRFVIGGGAMLLGVALLFLGLFGDVENGIRYVGLGAFLVFVGAFVLGPLFARVTSLIISAPLPRMKGMTGTLARENAARNPKRTATTATALIIGVALVGFITIFAASAKKSIASAVENQFNTDYIIRGPGNFTPGVGLTPRLADEVAALPEVENSTAFRLGDAGLGDSRIFLNAMNPQEGAKLFDLGDVAGTLDDLNDNGIAVSERKADDKNWKLGDTVDLTFVKTGDVPLQIQYIFSENTFGDYYITLENYDRNFQEQLDSAIFANLAPGVTAEEGKAAIEPLLEPFPNAKLQDNAQFKEDQQSQINTIVTLIYALLFLALFIALIGIANTLALSIYERTRELGLLRAVGMSRSQVRSAIRWESIIICVLGTINGLAIGLLFGWSVVRALKDEGFSEFAIAPGQLLIVVLVLAVASVGAAILPARRASRLDVIEAISSE